MNENLKYLMAFLCSKDMTYCVSKSVGRLFRLTNLKRLKLPKLVLNKACIVGTMNHSQKTKSFFP